jgi:hypothetical protein
MTLGIAIAGFVATVAAAFGGAWYGGRLQRSANVEVLALQLQLDAVAKFIGAVSDFSLAYSLAWAPGTNPATLTERHRPLFEVLTTLRLHSAALGLVAPDRLMFMANNIVRVITHLTLTPFFDHVFLTVDLTLLIEEFELEARELLKPGGQKNGRKWIGQSSAPTTDQSEAPGQ